MSSSNRYIAQDAATLKNPLTFATATIPLASAAEATKIRTSIDLILAALAKEGTDPTDHRLFLDEMSPVARASMYRMLSDLKTSVVTAEA